jgi:hypothetical protein
VAVPNSTFDQVSAITNDFYMPKFPENVFKTRFVLMKLWKKGTKVSSGNKIRQPLVYQKGNGGAFNPRAQFNIAAKDQITAAQFNWKHYYVPISIFDDELLVNDGPAGVRKLLDAKMKVAKNQIADDISTDMFKTSTSYYGDSDIQINSVVGACGNASYPDSNITYGGIQKTSGNSFWHGNVTNQGGALTLAAMETMFLNCSKYGDTPDLITCASNQVENIYSLQASNQRYLDQKVMDLGFVAYTFKGVPVVPDEHVTSTEIYFLNTDYLDLVSHRKQNMRFEKFQKPIDQAAAVAKIFWMGNLTCSDCRRQGVIYGVTA